MRRSIGRSSGGGCRVSRRACLHVVNEDVTFYCRPVVAIPLAERGSGEVGFCVGRLVARGDVSFGQTHAMLLVKPPFDMAGFAAEVCSPGATGAKHGVGRVVTVGRGLY